MKKLLLALGVVVGLASVALAVQSRAVPQDKRGEPISHPLYGGADATYQIGTSASLVCTGKCLLLGVARETGPVATHILLRDSIAADDIFVPNRLPLFHHQTDTGAHDNPVPFPVLFSNGIVVDQSAAGSGVSVLYLDLD